MEPIVKWYGGLENNLEMLQGMLPHQFENYYEPFLGGGAMYMSMVGKSCHVNDKCPELMNIYKLIGKDDGRTVNFFSTIAAAWKKMEAHFLGVVDDLSEINERNRLGLYRDYRNFVAQVNEIVDRVNYRNIFYRVMPDPPDFKMQLRHCVIYEMLRMEKLFDIEDKDIERNLLFAMKLAIYDFLMEVVNREEAEEPVRAAALAFILNYCTDMPFKRDEWGQIRFPFGPREKAEESLAKKVKMLKSDELKGHFAKTGFHCCDALEFLHVYKPKENDFIFLDPPAEVKKEAGEMDFSPIQHRQLATFLLRTPAKWMLLVQRNCTALPRYREAGMKVSRIKGFDKLIIRNY